MLTAKQRINYNRALELLGGDNAANKEKAMTGALLIIRDYNLDAEQKQKLMNYLYESMKYMDDYCNSHDLNEHEIDLMLQKFNKLPTSIYKYQVLAHEVFKDKESFLRFKLTHKRKLITHNLKNFNLFNLMELIEGDKDLFAKITQEVLGLKSNLWVVRRLVDAVDDKKLVAYEEDYDLLTSFIIMNELA